MKIFIFACIHNAGRSQMSVAFLNQLADPQKARVVSAGTQPAAAVHLVVVEIMQKIRTDLFKTNPGTTRLPPQTISCVPFLKNLDTDILSRVWDALLREPYIVSE